MGLREPSIVSCFIEFVFQYFFAQVLVGLRKEFKKNIVFATWACAAGFNNNNNNNCFLTNISGKNEFYWNEPNK